MGLFSRLKRALRLKKPSAKGLRFSSRIVSKTVRGTKMIPDWAYSLPLDLISYQSQKTGLNRAMVAALVMVESAGKRFATRYEPNFKFIFDPYSYAKSLNITQFTEEEHQKTSWGLLQIMGVVARELGFKGYLPELCTSELGLKYGCLKLKELYERYDNINDVVAAYNAGSAIKTTGGHYVNERYVDKVFRYYRELI